MAEQKMPPGGRPGRPFVAPFSRPGPGSGAPPAPANAQPTPERQAPRPFVPPATAGRPVAPRRPPVAPPPAEPRAPLPPPVAARPAQLPVPAPSDGAVEGGLALEHAISETLGQGAPPPTPAFDVERASESVEIELPGARGAEPEGPNRRPELTFLTGDPEDTMSSGPLAGGRGTVAAVEAALAEEARSGAAGADPEVPAPQVDEPLPWLAPPTASSPGTLHATREVPTPILVPAAIYEADPKPGRGPATPPFATTSLAGPETGRTVVGANLAVAAALESVAQRVRLGELRVPAVDESAGEPGALAAALAVLLGVRS